MTFVSGINWKASFTPPTKDTYIVTITDVTLGSVYSQNLIAASQATPIQSVEAITTVTTATLLAAVEQAIAARLNGGAVQSYSIGGRNLQYMTIESLMKLRDQLKAESSSGSGGARNYVSFENPD
jgi:hypothetical protein